MRREWAKMCLFFVPDNDIKKQKFLREIYKRKTFMQQAKYLWNRRIGILTMRQTKKCNFSHRDTNRCIISKKNSRIGSVQKKLGTRMNGWLY